MNEIDDIAVNDPPAPAWASIPPGATSTYANLTANNNSRIHNGHVFHFHQHHTLQSHRNDSVGTSSQTTLKRKRSLADIEENPRTRKTQEGLEAALKKLSKLALSVRHRKEGDGAEKTARRIAAVFEAITTHEDAETWDKTAARQLGKLGATVRWEEQFDINSVPEHCAVRRNVRAKKRQILVHIGNWNISLTTTIFDSRREGCLQEVETFSTLRVEPRHQSTGSALAVFFSEHRYGCSTSTIPPTVLAYNMVDFDAEVFYVIEKDDLDNLLRLLASGESSIRDCDESGRSLLNYACSWNSPKCCSFLVGGGVDIDRFEKSFESVSNRCTYVSPLQIAYMAISHPGTSPCFDILWRAGADPTITADHYNLPPMLAILKDSHYYYSMSPLVYACLKRGNPYLDAQEKTDDNEGRGYWLEICMSPAVVHDPSLLQLFADKGSDITEVDEFGFNCLFVFMSRAHRPNTAQEYKALRCLLEIFKDIHALDATGNDIFAHVNEVQDWPEKYTDPLPHMLDNGSYRQDLWYCALARSKLHDHHTFPPCNRLARYTESYTPKHYLALCHLDEWHKWNEERFERQIQPVLHKYPLSEEEERIQKEMEDLWKWES